jgi:hypothetical protein
LLPATADAAISGAEAAAIGGVGAAGAGNGIDAADAAVAAFDGGASSFRRGPAGAAATREPAADGRDVVLRGGRGAALGSTGCGAATVRGGGATRWRTRGGVGVRSGRGGRGAAPEGAIGAGFSPSTSVTSGATCESLRCGGNAACVADESGRLISGGSMKATNLRVTFEVQPTVTLIVTTGSSMIDSVVTRTLRSVPRPSSVART